MRIKLKLFATLTALLPPGAQDHTIELELAEGTRVRAAIEQLRIPPELARLVMVDGFHLTPGEVEGRILREGETLAIFPPIAGG
ncbi:MAG: MoaD/ThiS family protein [Candidatus Lambdaproteobacteria bacterium]|nr:MoaD/ThiS family protein [Candidatus Lambdaproteobacteria bacterium]